MPTRAFTLQTRENHIFVAGELRLGDYRRVLAAIHNLTHRLGYQDIVLDFERCSACFAGPILAIGATVARMRREGVDADLLLPKSGKLRNLFLNAGWAHIIDPAHHDSSHFRGYSHVPAIQYSSAAEQKAAVDNMVDKILCSLDGLDRNDLNAVEWSLNEVTDNVLAHADSPIGGFVSLTNFKARHKVEFTVVDPGVGILTTLKEGHPEIRFDADALDRAISVRVTRDPSYGQGNGLYGTFEIAAQGQGNLHIHSGFARLDYYDGGVHIRSEQIPFNGTLVVASMDCSQPASLGEALRFGGERYDASGYVESRFEVEARPELWFRLAKESSSFGSRDAGTPVRTKLENLVLMHPDRVILVDCRDVPLISSSFADEVFGKLFVALGPVRFTNALELRSMSATVRSLVDKAVLQRAKEP